jgi:hypothetical protein
MRPARCIEQGHIEQGHIELVLLLVRCCTD